MLMDMGRGRAGVTDRPVRLSEPIWTAIHVATYSFSEDGGSGGASGSGSAILPGNA
jgi:hypothetical protein